MTARWLRSAEPEVLTELARAAHVFAFLDYDGTLAPLAPTPDVALPLPGTAQLLQELVAAPGVEVAIVSGRPIAAVRCFLDVAGMYCIGVHGAEMRWPDGTLHMNTAVEAVRVVLPEVRQRLQKTIGAVAGILIEDKGIALACHYRLAAPADAAAARATVAALVEELRQRGAPVTLGEGHAVSEIRAAGVSKGTAVRALLASQAPHALPLYIGDDRTDEDAFAALPEQAITIRVGLSEEPTQARYRLETPEAVQEFLQAVVAMRAR